ncbi:MAG: 50S ribosomal protein L23 [Patescibacteria group bacterium]
MVTTIIYHPIVSEKSIHLGAANKYTFSVDERATVVTVKTAIEELFKVKVTAVNILNVKGKPKQAGRAKVRRKNWKKAIITLQPGQTIKLFEEKVSDAN